MPRYIYALYVTLISYTISRKNIRELDAYIHILPVILEESMGFP